MALNLSILHDNRPLRDGAGQPIGPTLTASSIDLLTGSSELFPQVLPVEILSNAKKVNHIAWLKTFQGQFPSAFKLLQLCGIHPTQVEAKGDRPIRPHVGQHSLAVAAATQVFTHALFTKSQLPLDECRATILRALLHDGNKPLELSADLDPSTTEGRNTILSAIYETELHRLMHQGINEKTISAARQAWGETGPYSIRRLLVVEHDRSIRLIKGKLSSKLLHLADMMSYTSIPRGDDEPLSAILTPWERILTSQAQTKNSWLFEQGLGINPSGRIIAIRNALIPPRGVVSLGNYAILHVVVAELIAEELKQLIDPTSPDSASVWARKLLEKKLAQ